MCLQISGPGKGFGAVTTLEQHPFQLKVYKYYGLYYIKFVILKHKLHLSHLRYLVDVITTLEHIQITNTHT